ncbi:predicted protein [Postia placenta Mad-698-R]|nr:predicted protein [Postia placenta Mad-698-R]
MSSTGHRHSTSVSQNHKAQLANAYNELGKELSSQKIRVVGNYTLGKVIGEGTYGKVRLGVHRLSGTRVAIKQIPKAMSASLTREIHHHRQLHHPHVTQLFEVIATEANIWLVTELCSGGELFDYLAEKGRLNEEETRIIFGQLCLAVAYVHSKGIVHRDLKLENVLLDERCRVKLGDFGFTQVDVWSLGIILYTLLTGMLPFDDDDESIMRAKVIEGVFEDPEWLSEDSRDLIKNILQTDPEKRPSIAQILAHPWFTAFTTIPVLPASSRSSISFSSRPNSPMMLRPPSADADSQPQSALSESTYHSASSEFPTSVATTPDQGIPDDVFGIGSVGVKVDATPDERPQTPNQTPSRSSFSRSGSNANPKVPPAYPTRTPARTKRRSVSSTLSDPSTPTFEKTNGVLPVQDFSSLLQTPAPIIFSTPLERELLNSLSMLGFDTGQIVHSVLSDACDATGALWWMLKRRAEKRALEEVPAGAEGATAKSQAEDKGKHRARDKDSKKIPAFVHAAVDASQSMLLPAMTQAHSAPELQLIPPTPTASVTTRPRTPPRTKSPTSQLLSPTPSTADISIRSHPSTPGGSMKDKDGSKGRKARSGSVSIMQRATTALEAAGLVRKKSAEGVREEKEKERATDKRSGNGSGDEPRVSHGSGSSKLAKSPPLKSNEIAVPTTPPSSAELNHVAMSSPWVLTNSRASPPPTDSPRDTLSALPNITGNKGLGNRNRASLLSAFRMWLIDCLHLAFVTHAVYTYAVIRFGDESGLLKLTWRSFLQRNVRLLLIWEMLIKLMSNLLHIDIDQHSNICLFVDSFHAFTQGVFPPILYVGLSNAAAGDVLIAVSLCIILSGHRGGLPSRTDNVVRMLMLYGIETGILTSVCATSCLILYAIMPDNYIYIALYIVLSKVALNSLLATLNARRGLREATGLISSTIYPAQSRTIVNQLEEDKAPSVHSICDFLDAGVCPRDLDEGPLQMVEEGQGVAFARIRL